jgi:hypothetical protein
MLVGPQCTPHRIWLPLRDKAVGHAAADQAFVIRQFENPVPQLLAC